MVYNNIDLYSLMYDDKLYLIRYSHHPHPDYTIVRYLDVVNGQIKYKTNNDKIKRINYNKVKHRLFSDIHEMARSLHDCFIRRNIDPCNTYNDLFSNSQHERPELWI